MKKTFFLLSVVSVMLFFSMCSKVTKSKSNSPIEVSYDSDGRKGEWKMYVDGEGRIVKIDATEKMVQYVYEDDNNISFEYIVKNVNNDMNSLHNSNGSVVLNDKGFIESGEVTGEETFSFTTNYDENDRLLSVEFSKVPAVGEEDDLDMFETSNVPQTLAWNGDTLAMLNCSVAGSTLENVIGDDFSCGEYFGKVENNFEKVNPLVIAHSILFTEYDESKSLCHSDAIHLLGAFGYLGKLGSYMPENFYWHTIGGSQHFECVYDKNSVIMKQRIEYEDGECDELNNSFTFKGI